MDSKIYVFGSFKWGYTQYPNDDASSLFQKVWSKSGSRTQIGIHRNGNLMYYCYVRKLGDDDSYLGLCTIANGVFISDIEGLFSMFENAVADLAKKGIVIRYSDDGEIAPIAHELYKEGVDLDLFIKRLRDSFEDLEQGGKKLPPLDYSISGNTEKAYSITDEAADIAEASCYYGLVMVHKDSDFNTTEINSYRGVVARLNAENELLKKRNYKLSKVKKKKERNNYIPMFIVIAAMVLISLILMWYNADLRKEKDAITNVLKGQYIVADSLNKELESIKSEHPLTVKQVEFKNGHFCVQYYSYKDFTEDLKVSIYKISYYWGDAHREYIANNERESHEFKVGRSWIDFPIYVTEKKLRECYVEVWLGDKIIYGGKYWDLVEDDEIEKQKEKEERRERIREEERKHQEKHRKLSSAKPSSKSRNDNNKAWSCNICFDMMLENSKMKRKA